MDGNRRCRSVGWRGMLLGLERREVSDVNYVGGVSEIVTRSMPASRRA